MLGKFFAAGCFPPFENEVRSIVTPGRGFFPALIEGEGVAGLFGIGEDCRIFFGSENNAIVFPFREPGESVGAVVLYLESRSAITWRCL